MGGHFIFALRNPKGFDQERWVQALREARKIKPPPELYISYDGPSHGGMGLVLKVQHRQEWTMLLPLDPLKDHIECGFTYGIVSRKKLWDCIRGLLVSLCRAAPFAFEFSYEDKDLGEFSEVGFFDYQRDEFVVKHKGLPLPAEMERLALAGVSPLGTGPLSAVSVGSGRSSPALSSISGRDSPALGRHTRG